MVLDVIIKNKICYIFFVELWKGYCVQTAENTSSALLLGKTRWWRFGPKLVK